MTTNSLPVAAQPQAHVQVGLTDSQSFELAQRVAKCFSMSSLVPKDYQNNLPNCVIALNMATRMGADPLMVIQNLVVVHGRPTWSAQFLIATFNKCGRFSPLRYEFVGDQGSDDWGCMAKSTELATGEVLTGTLVTIAMAKKEGWFGKNGSKWQTMPQQMLMYRAASWFVRAYAPEIAMGLQTADEMRDTYDMERQGETYLVPVRGEAAMDLNEVIEAQVQQAEASLQQEAQPEAAHPDPTPENGRKRPSPAELEDMRAVLVQEIKESGLRLQDVEAGVGEYVNKWTASVMDKIRSNVIPNMKAELLEA